MSHNQINLATVNYSEKDNSIVVIYGEDQQKNVAMELDNLEEGELAKKVLIDPNFWVSIFRTLSSSLKNTLRSTE